MNWDSYFHEICNTIGKKSPCLSRHIGALLVRDNSIVSTGYNGPPRGIPHCGYDRTIRDQVINELIIKQNVAQEVFGHQCPRKALGFASGTHMEFCPAQHAEENAVSNAARLGVSVYGCTLFMNSVIPCQKCYGTLINAGIKEIVIEEVSLFDVHTQYLIDNSSILVRQFKP